MFTSRGVTNPDSHRILYLHTGFVGGINSIQFRERNLASAGLLQCVVLVSKPFAGTFAIGGKTPTRSFRPARAIG